MGTFCGFLLQAMDQGFDTILALGWYLDRQVPVDNQTSWFWEDTWQQMYNVALPATPSATPPATPPSTRNGDKNAHDRRAKGRMLGGEANMWTEQVNT